MSPRITVRMTVGSTVRMTVAVAGCVALLAGCTAGSPPGPSPAPSPVELSWREVSLPPSPDGRQLLVTAGSFCDGHWYLVGSLAHGDDTVPAAWTSLDGQTWTSQPVSAFSEYGVQDLLTTATCRDGDLGAIGSKVGGAHGNPRVSTYRMVDGVLTEVDAPFELYGGPNADNVGRMTAGPPGYLIVGNRSTGAAVWNSPDGAEFHLVENAPGLATTPAASTWANDGSWDAAENAWVVVGTRLAAGQVARDGAAWRSPDGVTWSAMPVESAPDYDELSVVTDLHGTLVAVGMHGDVYQAWRLGPDGWRMSGSFGARTLATSGLLSAAVPVDVVATGGTLLALVKAENVFHLWRSLDGGDSWAPVTPPAGDPPAAGGQYADLVAVPGGILLVTEDHVRARVWVAAIAS